MTEERLKKLKELKRVRQILKEMKQNLINKSEEVSKIPQPGRKLSHEEAMDYVFKEYHECFKRLAENGD